MKGWNAGDDLPAHQAVRMAFRRLPDRHRCRCSAHPPLLQDRDDAPSRYLPTPAVDYPGGVRSLRDVSFAELSGFRPLTLDLYLPPEGGAPQAGDRLRPWRRLASPHRARRRHVPRLPRDTRRLCGARLCRRQRQLPLQRRGALPRPGAGCGDGDPAAPQPGHDLQYRHQPLRRLGLLGGQPDRRADRHRLRRPDDRAARGQDARSPRRACRA